MSSEVTAAENQHLQKSNNKKKKKQKNTHNSSFFLHTSRMMHAASTRCAHIACRSDDGFESNFEFSLSRW